MSTVIFMVNHAMYIVLLLTSLRLLCPLIIMQDGITHNSNIVKGSVYFDWTAPAAGSGPLRFGYTIIQCHTIGRQAVSTKGYTISLSSASKFRR